MLCCVVGVGRTTVTVGTSWTRCLMVHCALQPRQWCAVQHLRYVAGHRLVVIDTKTQPVDWLPPNPQHKQQKKLSMYQRNCFTVYTRKPQLEGPCTVTRCKWEPPYVTCRRLGEIIGSGKGSSIVGSATVHPDTLPHTHTYRPSVMGKS